MASRRFTKMRKMFRSALFAGKIATATLCAFLKEGVDVGQPNLSYESLIIVFYVWFSCLILLVVTEYFEDWKRLRKYTILVTLVCVMVGIIAYTHQPASPKPPPAKPEPSGGSNNNVEYYSIAYVPVGITVVLSLVIVGDWAWNDFKDQIGDGNPRSHNRPGPPHGDNLGHELNGIGNHN